MKNNLPQVCFIRVEVKKRELVSRLDIAIELVKRGIPVIIGECTDPNILLKLGSKKSYFFGKCAQTELLNIYRDLLDNDWTFGALDEEGLLPDSLESFANKRFSQESASVFKDVFFFGNKQRDTFKNIFGNKESYIVSGNPRIDMWKSKCYGLYNYEIKKIKEKYGDFILLPLNFRNYTNIDRHKLYINSLTPEKNKEISEKSEYIFDNFCKLAELIARRCKQKVVIRPHPSDDLKFVKKLIYKHGVRSELVKCINSLESFPWVYSSRILFHNCCTTSLEAGFCSTPVFTFSPSNTSLYQDSEINDLFPTIHNYDEALEILNKNNTDIRNISDFKSKIKKWDRLMLRKSGNTSSFIAEQIIRRNTFEMFNTKKTFNRHFEFTRIRSELLAKISSLMGDNERKVLINKFPNTNVDEVKNIVSHICRFRGYKNKPEIKQINSHLFALYT